MIHFIDVSKYFGNKVIFDQVNCHIPMGSLNYVIGDSGSGKTTFLRLILKAELLSSGEILFLQRPLQRLKGRSLLEHRQHIGLIEQHHRFFWQQTVEANLKTPLTFARKKDGNEEIRIKNLAERLRIEYCLTHRMEELSAGEKQMIAIARAVINDPILILADEPNQYLDKTQTEIAAGLLYEKSQSGTTVVIASQQSNSIPYPKLNLFWMQHHQIQLI